MMADSTTVARPAGAEPADPLAAPGLDEAALDLLVRPRGLVEMTLPADAPLYAAYGVEDWSGAVHDLGRLAGLGCGGLDMVFDGDGGGSCMAADPPAFVAADALIPDGLLGDPLIELAPLSGEAMLAVPPFALDTPVHVDVAIDAAARIDFATLDLREPELSWLAAINGSGLHVGETWSWSEALGGYVFDHYV